jgi:hypothetical protein
VKVALFAAGLFGVLGTVTQAQVPSQPQGQPQCQIEGLYGAQVGEIVAEGYAFPEFASFCPWLRDNGLGLEISGDSGVIEDRAYGWATIRLVRRSDRLIARVYSQTTALSNDANATGARNALRGAVNSALSLIAQNRDEHLTRFGQYQAQLRRQ